MIKISSYKLKRLGIFIGDNKNFSGKVLNEKIIFRVLIGFFYKVIVIDILKKINVNVD